MKYAFEMDGKRAEIDFSDALTIEELEIVKDTLQKMCDARIVELQKQNQNMLTPSDDIDSLYPPLSVRARNVLKRNGCDTIGDVLGKTPSDLKLMRNMGKHCLEEIMERMSKYGSFREGQTESEE